MKKKQFSLLEKIGTVFFSQRRHVLQTGRRHKAPDSETYEQNTLGGERETGRKTAAVITHAGNRGFDGQM